MKLKTLWRNGLLILFGLLLALVMAEVGLRLIPNRLLPQVIVQLPRKWGPLRPIKPPPVLGNQVVAEIVNQYLQQEGLLP